MSVLSAEYFRAGGVKVLIVRPSTTEERERARGVVGSRYVSEKQEIRFPPEPSAVTSLLTVLPTIVIDQDVQQWYEGLEKQKQHLLQQGQQEDAVIAHPNAVLLRPYQRVGATWLAERKRAILADQMGLGKTASALFACHLVHAKTILIVTVSIAKAQWAQEALRWVGLHAVVANGTSAVRQQLVSKNPPVLIINYEMLRESLAKRNADGTLKVALYPELQRRTWDVVILDEAQKLQDMHARQSKAAKYLKAKHVFLLTGTPLWNMPDSIWHPLHVLDKKRFSSKTRFIAQYALTFRDQYATHVIGINPHTKQKFQSILSEYMLRRVRTEVLSDLPDITYTTLFYTLTQQQKKAYRSVENTLYLPETNQYFANVASSLAALRGLCNDPIAKNVKGGNPKDALILELVQNILENEQKTALLVWHRDYGRHLSQLLQAAGIRTVLATGDTSAEERMKRIESAKHDDTQVIVGSIAAMGTAINLDVISVAVFCELDWTPLQNEQAAFRFLRYTSTKNVLIYRIIGRHTIEQHILDVVEHKSGIANELMAMQEVIKAILAHPLTDD